MALITVVTACNQEKEAVTEKTKKEETSKKQAIEVDKGLLNVEITLPASLLKDQDVDSLMIEAKNDGIKDVTKNDDGSLTYKMSKSQHKKLMKELEVNLLKTIDDTKNNEDFASIKDVKHNKPYTEFTLVVDQEKFNNSFDGFASLGLGMSGMFYQLFNGTHPDDLKVSIKLENEQTGQVFDTVVYPDDLEEKK